MVVTTKQKKRSTTMRQFDTSPYIYGTAIRKMLRNLENNLPPRIAFLDIDATMTGDPDDTNATREILENRGYCVVFVTARTEEMLLSKKAYHESRKAGFGRPQPNLDFRDGHFRYTPPEIFEPKGLIDADIISGSTGTQIIVRQEDGSYLSDQSYDRTMGESADHWRKKALELVQMVDHEGVSRLSQLEDLENYVTGVTNVAPPKYRVAVEFDSLERKLQFMNCWDTVRKQAQTKHFFTNVRLIDDSHPKHNAYAVCLTPRHGGKGYAVDHIIQVIRTLLPKDRLKMEILISGDGYPDLEMGLMAAHGSNVTFIIPGGAHVAKALIKPGVDTFAGEDIRDIKRRLRELTSAGQYIYHANNSDRNVIVGDQAFTGLKEVASIRSFLEENADMVY